MSKKHKHTETDVEAHEPAIVVEAVDTASTAPPSATAKEADGDTDEGDTDEVERKERTKLKFETAMPRDEVTAYFEAITAGLRKGAVRFRQGNDILELHPAPHVALRVKVSKKEDRERITFEVEWAPGDAGTLQVLPD